MESNKKSFSALSAPGISITQQQKDDINRLVASGDIEGAQKIILEILSVLYGDYNEAT